MTASSTKVFFLSIPGLRVQDLGNMPGLKVLCDSGSQSRIEHSFPCVTWPSQAAVLTGKAPESHGVIANGFYWRDNQKVEMWTAWNEVIQQPQIWDVLKEQKKSSLAWFPMLSKGCGADYVCMPAPVHKPDGSEDLWCYTKPQEFYAELLEELQHFPLQHFWGPLANIKSTQWIADSAVKAVDRFKPDFNYIYFPHLDYAAQKTGPDSEEAIQATRDLDQLITSFADDIEKVAGGEVVWIIASEYVITPVDHVLFPNRKLREAGLLKIKVIDGREHIDFEQSDAWALVDHQFSHIFLNSPSDTTIEKIKSVFEPLEGVDQVLCGEDRSMVGMNHERSGEVVLISTHNSWQAYYWWLDDSLAPEFATTVDIHRKPGYDPIELHFDFANKKVPLDASLAKGSHGAPAKTDSQQGLFLSSTKLNLKDKITDTEIFNLVLQQYR